LLLQFCIMRKLVQCGKYFRSRAVPPYTSFTVYIYFGVKRGFVSVISTVFNNQFWIIIKTSCWVLISTSASRLSKQCGILNVSQPYGLLRPFKRTVLLLLFSFNTLYGLIYVEGPKRKRRLMFQYIVSIMWVLITFYCEYKMCYTLRIWRFKTDWRIIRGDKIKQPITGRISKRQRRNQGMSI
jgi:hypothetical protein